MGLVEPRLALLGLELVVGVEWEVGGLSCPWYVCYTRLIVSLRAVGLGWGVGIALGSEYIGMSVPTVALCGR